MVHHSGVVNSFGYNNYAQEAKKMLSFHCGHNFSQAFERLCSYMKDCLIKRGEQEPKILIYKMKKEELIYNRTNLPGGDPLYKLVCKASGNAFAESSLDNNMNIKFKEFWTIIQESRHAIVHTESIVKFKRIKLTKYHSKLFDFLYPNHLDLGENFELFLTYKNLEKLIDLLADFAFQIFKSLSIQEELDWKYFIREKSI